MVFRRLLRPLRRLSATFFYNFGLHCAKNQIRVILISDLVITSLFYPALAIYFSSQPLSHFSTRLQDSLLALNNDNLGSYRADLQDIWEVLDVRVQVDTAAQARCGSERTVRLERLLIPSVQPDDVHGVLTNETFAAVLELQNRLQGVLTSPSYRDVLDCINDPKYPAQPTCLVFGPLDYWQNDKPEPDQTDQTRNVIEAINSAQDIVKAGVPLSKELTLARRGSADERNWIYEADFLVLTYFFPETDCHANTRHTAWSQAVQEAVSGLGSAAQIPKQPKLVALQLSATEQQLTYRASILSVILYICYIVIFVYFSGALRRIDTVHSRFGLVFTGMVEIMASTITSVSVCALWGFRVTMVPWAILPVMIVFIGAEDMFILVHEVVSTPITLPVKERIAQGLSRAGTSNTFKVCAYNAIFGSMAYFTTGAIKQFCIFTVVVLVAHWFLIHTFFVAVLAIDIQRLELADMIDQGPRTHSTVDSPAKEKVIEEVSSAISKGRWRFFRRDRAAKNGSLLVILSITALLYYASLPTTLISPTKVTAPKPTDAARASFFQSMSVAHETSRPSDDFSLLPNPTASASTKSSIEFWKTFNPDNNPLLHLRVESPTFVQLRPRQASPQPPMGRRKALSRRLRPLTWAMKIVVLPMSATALALYCLLLYLLKDADLLEAQRNRAEGDGTGQDYDADSPSAKALEGSASFATLSRPFIADVDLIATSKDGRVIAAISTEDEFAVWNVEDGSQREVGRKTLMLSTALAAIVGGDLRDIAFTSIALDEAGDRCAVGTSVGLVLTWSIEEGMWSTKHVRCGTDSSISHLEFLSPPAMSMSASTSTIKPTTSVEKPDPIHILARSSKGKAYLWDPLNQLPPLQLPLPDTLAPVEPAVLTDDSGRIKLACGLSDGSLRILSSTLDSSTDDPEQWTSRTISNVGDDVDFITQISLSGLFVGPRHVEMVAVATYSGRVLVYECGDGKLVCALTGNFEEVTRLRLISIPWKRCDKCGEMEADSFGVAFSAASVIDVHRVVAVLVPSRCSCPMTQLLRGSGSRSGLREKYMAQRSRSSSTASSPAMRRTALPPTKTISRADYPLPQHGYHSRRTSERESRPRLSTETTSDQTEFDAESSIGEASSTLAVPGVGDSPLRVRTGSASGGGLRVVKVEEIPCDRGTWDVSGPLIIGIRRRPRRTRGAIRAEANESGTRLPPSPFSRWDAWMYDLQKGELLSSALLALKTEDAQVLPANGHTQPLQNGNSLIQRSAGLRRLVELSGPKSSMARPSPSTSSPAYDTPVLPFTRVSALAVTPERCCVGLGNTAAILDLRSTRKSSDTIGSKKQPLFGSVVDKKFL